MGLVPAITGRTELKCLFCDRLDPMEMAETQNGPMARLLFLFPSQSPEHSTNAPAGSTMSPSS